MSNETVKTKSHKRKAEVIEVYPELGKAAVRFSSGRIECVRRFGGQEFFVGQRGIADYVRSAFGYEWAFTAFKKQASVGGK